MAGDKLESTPDLHVSPSRERRAASLHAAIDFVEDAVGMGHGAWDCVQPEELARAFQTYWQNHGCQHEIADLSNKVISSGYMCVKCGDLFKAAGK